MRSTKQLSASRVGTSFRLSFVHKFSSSATSMTLHATSLLISRIREIAGKVRPLAISSSVIASVHATAA